jgi:hypothetical protein
VSSKILNVFKLTYDFASNDFAAFFIRGKEIYSHAVPRTVSSRRPFPGQLASRASSEGYAIANAEDTATRDDPEIR